MQSMKLIHPDINLKACTCLKDKPWYHPIILQLIKAQWWGKKGEARELGMKEDSNPFISIPLPLMALVATAVRFFPLLTVFVNNPDVCQDRFFTDLISTRGLGVRGWPSGKTKMLHSVVALPK